MLGGGGGGNHSQLQNFRVNKSRVRIRSIYLGQSLASTYKSTSTLPPSSFLTPVLAGGHTHNHTVASAAALISRHYNMPSPECKGMPWDVKRDWDGRTVRGNKRKRERPQLRNDTPVFISSPYFSPPPFLRESIWGPTR